MWLALLCERLEEWEEGIQALQRMSQLRPEADEWKGLRYRFQETMRKQEAGAAEKPPGQPSPAVEEAAQPEQAPSTTTDPPGTPGRRATPPEQLEDSSR
jgi:hypothetical protein